MATSYEGPATIHTHAGDFPVKVRLSTSVGCVYSWQGSASTTDLAAMHVQGQGGTVTLPVPGTPAGAVHVAVTELHPGGGILLRLHGSGRAPYEVDGDIVTTVRDDGGTFYEKVQP